MTTEEKNADAYRAMTDSTRHLVRWTRDNPQREQRIKLDPETHPEAELDYEKKPTSFRAASAGYWTRRAGSSLSRHLERKYVPASSLSMRRLPRSSPNTSPAVPSETSNSDANQPHSFVRLRPLLKQTLPAVHRHLVPAFHQPRPHLPDERLISAIRMRYSPRSQDRDL